MGEVVATWTFLTTHTRTVSDTPTLGMSDAMVGNYDHMVDPSAAAEGRGGRGGGGRGRGE